MTITGSNGPWPYTAAPGATTFQYTDKIFAASDLQVYVDLVLQGGGYTVTNVGVAGGGNVVFDTPMTGGEAVLILRATPATQELDYVEGDKILAEVHEGGLDRLTVLVQQLFFTANRSLRLGPTDPATALPAMPTLESLKGALLGFDPVTGAPIATTATLDAALVSSFVAGILTAADAAAFRSAIGVVFGTAVGNVPQLVDVSGTPGFAAGIDGSQLVNIGGSEAIGSVKEWLFSMPPAGWLLLNGDTIGDASSSATHQDDDYQTLFEGIWADFNDTKAPVTEGRGASANDDWLAHKQIALPDVQGRGTIAVGAGAGLTARALGDSGGTETHLLTAAQSGLPAHNHSVQRYVTIGSASGGDPAQHWTATTTVNTGNNTAQDASQAHPNMQPWYALPKIVRAK